MKQRSEIRLHSQATFAALNEQKILGIGRLNYL